jgi:Holliday junction resolvase RusA-like endonuclease
MTDGVSFVCQGDAVAQPRGRAFNIPGLGIRVASAPSRHPIHRWKDALRADAKSAMLGLALFDCPLALELTFLMKRPGSMPKRTLNDTIPHTKKPDLDNLEKAVKDALTSIVWRDDCLVSAVAKRKRYVRGGEAPGVHIRVTPDIATGAGSDA